MAKKSTKQRETEDTLERGVGDNYDPADTAAGFSRGQLKSFVERIERLEEEKATIADDIKDVYAEAKGNGFDTKAIRAIIRRRKMDVDQLAEHEAIVGLYTQALGMLADTPLGRAAMPDR